MEHILFSGNVPENYDRYLGPFLFEPYAINLVTHVDTKEVHDVLEIACGTGRVTKHLYQLFQHSAGITASDFSTDMVNTAKKELDNNHIHFIQADAQALPFEDNSFDLVVCQFGFMFVPDKPKAFSEAFRVLRKGGHIVFNTWDKLENNPATNILNKAVLSFFKEAAPPFFYLPHSMHNEAELHKLLKDAGFSDIQIKCTMLEGISASALNIAKGFTTGTPMFAELNKLDPSSIEKIIATASEEIAITFGDNPAKTPLSAWVCKAFK